MDIIRPVINVAKEGEIKERLENAVSLLSARNELLVVADGDVSVFAFYDQQKKAETTKDPILRAAWAPAPPQYMPERARGHPKMEFQGTSDGSRMELRPTSRGPQVRTCAISADGSDTLRPNANFRGNTNQIQSLLGSNAISVCTNTGISINPLSVAEDLSDLNKYLEEGPYKVRRFVKGEKWMAWCDTIAIARNQGQEELAQIVGKSANCSLAPSTMSAYSSMRYRFEAFGFFSPQCAYNWGSLETCS
ncbi:hypothetical protein COOONC_26608 [Cooperia oncophora]